MGGRPLPLGCGGPRAQRAVSSSFVKFRQIDEIDETARWLPTTRDPGQDLQSLPLLVTMHMALCMERKSWFIVMLVFAQGCPACHVSMPVGL